MANNKDWVRSVRRRLREAQKAARLLNQELVVLASMIPWSSDELAAVLSGKSPLTLELLVVGLVNLAHFHSSESGETLTLALMATNGKLNPESPIWRLRDDFCNSMANVLAVRLNAPTRP